MSELVAYLYDREVGRFIERDDGGVVFSYNDEWLAAAKLGRGHALSVSLPLRSGEQSQEATEAFIAGLLPDSLAHRKILAAELDIGDNPSDFAFLSHLGRDCAGAITVVPADEIVAHKGKPSYEVLSDEALAEYIRTLPQKPLLVDEDEGVLLSLAGVNDKAAVVVVNGQVALPHFGHPTTHIIKPDIAALPESIRVEHFCLLVAKECGQHVPKTKIRQVEDQVFMQMARYDRAVVAHAGGPKLERLHQEDFCQAMSVSPLKKYERHGGPSWADCFHLVRTLTDPVVATQVLLDRAIFQYYVGNPDAHAKNYSLLYKPNGEIRLSPFYDLNNAAAYQMHFKKMKPLMAMAIGGEFDRTKVTIENWLAFSDECGVDAKLVLSRLKLIAEIMVKATPRLRAQVAGTVADSARLDIVEVDVVERAKALLASLDYDHAEKRAQGRSGW